MPGTRYTPKTFVLYSQSVHRSNVRRNEVETIAGYLHLYRVVVAVVARRRTVIMIVDV